MYDIVGKKRWYFLFSALITIPGLIFVLLVGLDPTIDFTGGTTWEVEYLSNPDLRQRDLLPVLYLGPLWLPVRNRGDRCAPARGGGGGRHLRHPGVPVRSRVRCPVRDGAADDHRLLGARHDRRLRPHPGEPHPPRGRALRRDRQPLDPADPRALDQHQPDGRGDPGGA